MDRLAVRLSFVLISQAAASPQPITQKKKSEPKKEVLQGSTLPEPRRLEPKTSGSSMGSLASVNSTSGLRADLFSKEQASSQDYKESKSLTTSATSSKSSLVRVFVFGFCPTSQLNTVANAISR